MNDAEIFIVGANGQLGRALRGRYPNARFADKDELDITNRNSVMQFDWSGIKYLLNAAAYTNVDGAETPDGRKDAWLVNATAVAHLSEAAAARDMTLVHISTDYVFDGTVQTHTEIEPLSPLSVYGASKAAGDTAASLAQKQYTIRASWVIGEGKNFVGTMLSLAERNISPTVVHDQIGKLTFTSELVRAIHHLLESNAPYGTYNVSNSGNSASWADITREIFKLAGREDLTVTNTTTEEYYKGKEGIAPRPLQSTLDLSKIQSTGFKSTDWQADLASFVKTVS